MADDSMFTRNLAEAKVAVKYVQGVIIIGAANKPKDVAKGVLATTTFGISRGIEHPGLRALVTPPVGPLETRLALFPVELAVRKGMGGGEREYEFIANLAYWSGSGNCSHHAALAFIFLRDRGTLPLDFMDFTDFDHAFVLVGRLAEGTQPSNAKASKPETWGSDCVVCDAYTGDVYPARDFDLHWRGKATESSCRID